MSSETSLQNDLNSENEVQENIQTRTSQPAAPEKTVSLDKALQAIKVDARNQPKQYLDETVAPDGGE